MTDTTNEGPQLFAANEIMGAALTAKMSKSDILSFEQDPRSFIASSLNFDTGDISVSVVENDSATLNLALPYYSDLERLSAEVLKDADIDDVSGGELLITIGLLVAASFAGVVATGATIVGVGAGIGAAAGAAGDGSDSDGSGK